MRHAMICIRTEEPDYSALLVVEYDWAHSVYGTVTKLQQEDWPTPRGKHVTLSHFVDANLYHDIVMGRYVTGILPLLTRHQLTGTPRNKVLSRPPTLVRSLLPHEHAQSRS